MLDILLALFGYRLQPTRGLPDLELHRGRWADNLGAKGGQYIGRDWAIRCGLVAAGKGSGYLLTVEQTNGSTRVNEPHSFKVRAEYPCGARPNGDGWDYTMSVLDFEIHASSYTTKRICYATVEGLKTAVESEYEHKESN